MLRKTKEQSDYLIVGVTTDEEAFRLKNRKQIIPFEERIAIVRAIKYVNEAIPEDNADKLVHGIRLNLTSSSIMLIEKEL